MKNETTADFEPRLKERFGIDMGDISITMDEVQDELLTGSTIDDILDRLGEKYDLTPLEAAQTLAGRKTVGAKRRLDNHRLSTGISRLVKTCHDAARAAGWWANPHTGHPIERNDGELICLMHSELSEVMEANRKGLMSEKLQGMTGEEEELADVLIRIADYAGAKNFDLGEAVTRKLEYNASRADHKPENRVKPGGKSY